MSRRFGTWGLAIVTSLALAGATSAAPLQTAAGTSGKPSQSKAGSKSSSAAEHSVTGTLEKFDANSKTLTVHTQKGSETLMLDNDAKIQQGTKALTASDLSAHTGSHVRVRYVDNNGQKMAKEIRLTSQMAKGGAKKPGR